MDLDRGAAATVFTEMLGAACANVSSGFFLLPFAARDGRIDNAYRERVYCYELFHQIRSLQESGRVPSSSRYALSAEIDKSGLRIVHNGGRHKPDLVWHIPGSPSENAVVVEVKQSSALTKRGLEKDLQTIATFLELESGPYESGVLLFFGPADSSALKARVQASTQELHDAGKISEEAFASLWKQVSVLHHREVGEAATDLGTLGGPI